VIVPDDLAVAVPALLRPLPGVVRVDLCGSRQRGEAGRFSDWDFVLQTEDFAATAAELPQALRQLDPLAAQWDRLSDEACFMIIVQGPTKVDVIVEAIPHVHEPAWTVTASTLTGLDAHFWDWTLWLASKVDAGKTDIVHSELARMHEHLLGPLGLPRPKSLPEAVDRYLEARGRWEMHLGVAVDQSLGEAVAVVVEHLRP
jgi:hypothetical protein